MKKLVVCILVILSLVIYFFNVKEDSLEKVVTPKESKEEVNVITDVPDNGEGKAKVDQQVKKSLPEKQSGKVSGTLKVGNKEIPIVQGEVVMEVGVGSGPNQLGIAEDGGGNGPGSFHITKDGEILIADTVNNRISSFRNGELQEVVSFGDRHMKGFTTRDGIMYALVAGKNDNTKFHVESYALDGTLQAKKIYNFDPGYLNTLRIEQTDRGTYVYGYEKTTLLTNNGGIIQSYGAPTLDGAKSIDTVINDKGNAVTTVRSKEGAPLSTHTDDGPYLEHRGTFMLKDGGYINVYGSDPRDNSKNVENPMYILVKKDGNHNVLTTKATPMGSSHASDQPIIADPETGRVSILKTIDGKKQIVESIDL